MEKNDAEIFTRTASRSSKTSHIEGNVEKVEVETSPIAERGIVRSIIIVLTVTFGMMINVGNTTAMSIALPTLQREMHLEPVDLQWVMSGYPLSSGCLFLVCGRLADLHGRKKMFLVGTLILGAFTLGSGFSNNVVTLNVLRAIQGIGAAATIPASLGILAESFPPSRARAFAFATFAAGAPVGASFGTVLGGVLTEFTAHTWRSPFFLFTGFDILCFIGAWFAMDEDKPSHELDKRVDWLGAFLVTTGLVLVVFVLSQGEVASRQWSTPYIIALLVVGVVFVAAFIYWQHYLERIQVDKDASYSIFTPPPLMKLSIWTRANGRFAVMMAIAFTNWCAFLTFAFWVPLYYQNYRNLSAMATVVRLLPMFISGMLCNIFVGFMASRVPLVALIGFGAGATSLACLLFAIIKPSATYWAYGLPATILSVMGADLVFSAGTLFIAKFSLPHEQSVAGALFNTMTQLGTAVGVTVSTVAFGGVARDSHAGDLLQAYHSAQWAGLGFGVVATALGVIFFRGVGVVGEKRQHPIDTPSEKERQKDWTDEEINPAISRTSSKEKQPA